MNPGNSIGGLKVLVLEDETLIVMLLEVSLEDLGCSVVGPASTVAEGLALIANAPMDVALLDLNLNRGETAYPVADALAARGVPFAFVTGSDAGSLQLPHRGRPTLQKPFGDDALEAVLMALSLARAA